MGPVGLAVIPHMPMLAMSAEAIEIAMAAVVTEITITPVVVSHIAREETRLVVAQIAAERPLVIKSVADPFQLLALVSGQPVAVVESAPLAEGMAVVAMTTEEMLAVPAVAVSLTPVAVLIGMPVAAILIGAGASKPGARSKTPVASAAIKIPFALMALSPESFRSGASTSRRRCSRFLYLGTDGIAGTSPVRRTSLSSRFR